MHPEIPINWLAILAAVVASFVIGSLWYGPLFGKVWQKAVGFGEDFKPSGKEIARGSLMSIAGALLMAYVLTHSVHVWRPSIWNYGEDFAPHHYGFFAGLFTWIGFIVPTLLNGVAYERKSWKLFGINAGYQFVMLQAMAMILAFWI